MQDLTRDHADGTVVEAGHGLQWLWLSELAFSPRLALIFMVLVRAVRCYRIAAEKNHV